jgi:hypothetical protein
MALFGLHVAPPVIPRTTSTLQPGPKAVRIQVSLVAARGQRCRRFFRAKGSRDSPNRP